MVLYTFSFYYHGLFKNYIIIAYYLSLDFKARDAPGGRAGMCPVHQHPQHGPPARCRTTEDTSLMFAEGESKRA